MNYQQKVKKGYTKDRDVYTKSAPKKKGGAPYNRNPPNRRSQSAPVGFGALEEILETDPEGFRIHDTLDQDVWDGEELPSEIQDRLTEIAEDFIDGLPFPVTIKDIRLTGSLANYNWSKYSDIDLHIIVDFSELDENKKMVKEMFDAKRLRWNEKHDIKIKDYDVELYVEDEGEEHRSTGIFSVRDGEWVKKPEEIEQNIDLETATKKASDIEQQIAAVSALASAGEHKKVIAHVDRLKEKIRSMRQAGLETEEMEFSPENIAFKLLRRNDLLDGLTKMKYTAYDRLMTLDD